MENQNKNSSLLGLEKGNRIYFVGIGGYSMCGLARICHHAGYRIAGSDMEQSHRIDQLKDLGIQVYSSHDVSHIQEFKPHCVVYTAAISRDNPELREAEKEGIPLYERSRFLGGINRLFNRIINIAGTHGKTTTTTLCALILEESGLDPTAHIGAEVSDWQSTVRIGQSHNLFVSEACEYNSSFLQFASTTAAILNIDHDHVDCFPTINDVINVFARFASTVPSDGYLVLPSFDPHVPAMLKMLREMKSGTTDQMPVLVTFGREFDLFQSRKPDFYFLNYKLKDGYPSFDVYWKQTFYCHIDMAIPGEHNALNALAAIACAVLNGAGPEACTQVLSQFHGADNRFSDRGEYRGAKIIADYAHHPSAIKASYLAAKEITRGNVWTVFQPITYSRAISLFNEFADTLADCPDSMLFEVYTSRETNNHGFSSSMICDKIRESGGKSHFLTNYTDLKNHLDRFISPGDVVLIMGPEGMKKFADQLVREDMNQ